MKGIINFFRLSTITKCHIGARLAFMLIIFFYSLSLFSQSVNDDHKRIKIGNIDYLLVGIDDHPNGKHIAIN